jgi:hypothetical protein
MILQNAQQIDFCLNSHYQVVQSVHFKKSGISIKIQSLLGKEKTTLFWSHMKEHYKGKNIRIKIHKLYQAKMKAYEES